MARKGKGRQTKPFIPVHADQFQKFLRGKPEPTKTFLGFPLITRNHNQVWRWDTLETVTF